VSTTPRLGFLGVGWIGRHRLQALAAAGAAEIAVVADPAAECARLARELAPQAAVTAGLPELLERDDLDAVVIATPSAQHAEQAVAALERGLAVFCQKPLGRDAREVRRVVDAARAADRLLGVDLSYRFTKGMQRIRERVRAGELGRIYAAELVFHNAYGPDKPWFYERQLSGGGCLIDLGVHLVDLALWTLDFPSVVSSSCRLFAGGAPLPSGSPRVEDYATARLDLAGGAVVQLACSWRLPAGREAVIGAAFYGTRGGAALENVDGSFYDFRAFAFSGTERRVLSEPPDAWGGRAAVEWARRLAAGCRFDPESERLVQAAEVLDGLYADGLRPDRERSG
jgi:predicted dehydrogenase